MNAVRQDERASSAGRKARLLGVVLLVGSLFASVSGCGSDDEGSGDPGPTHGTCDHRNIDASCIESKGSAAETEDQKKACLDAGASWSGEPCPTDELIGCCAYTFGNEFRQCFYAGTARDPVAFCMMWDDGVWTPAN